MSKVIGIDPGQTGAIALVIDGDVAKVWDMPITERLSGKGKEVNAYLLNDVIGEVIEYAGGAVDSCSLERVGTRRGEGSTSSFNFGRGVGVVEGVLAVRGIRTEFVTPAVWKKKFGLTGKDKDASRTLAIATWPDMAGDLKRKKDNGRSDAMFIGLYREAA